MAEHGGSVLLVASVAGLRSSPNIGAYGVSNAAVISLTTQLAVELAPAVAAQYPAGRLGVPEDVGEAAAYLLGDGAGWVTGQTLVLEGGRLSRGWR